MRALLARWQLPTLIEHHDPSGVKALYSAVNAFVSVAVMALIAHYSNEPFLFPSLGPTAFLLFYTPLAAPASPRNTLCGHLIGVLAGYAALAATGLLHTGPNLNDIGWARVGAAAIALGVTCGLMPLFGVAHPPAGATTLIVALGLLRTPRQLAVVMLAVLVLVIQGVLVNRLAGIRYPLWRPVAQGAPSKGSGLPVSGGSRP